MRILLVTDAWEPQLNGVVRTLATTSDYLNRMGHQVDVIHPGGFRTVPCPTYPSIRLAVMPRRAIARKLDAFAPDAIHIATEGPLGQVARGLCIARRLPFTTSFHTQFPEYLRLRAPIPVSWTYSLLRRFHAAAECTLVPTPTQRDKLLERGFSNVRVWSRGVDTSVFNTHNPIDHSLPRPVAVYMGRVAVEKNIEAFLNLALPGSKLVIGDGPDLDRLRQRHKSCHFTGALFGRELARTLAGADVFAFPSRTDTFGLVLLEAMACGLPVAAYPVQGPIDVIEHGVSGFLSEDLREAILAAMQLDRANAVARAALFDWGSATKTFASNLAPIDKKILEPFAATAARSLDST